MRAWFTRAAQVACAHSQPDILAPGRGGQNTLLILSYIRALYSLNMKDTTTINITQIATLIGVVLSFVVGSAGLWIGIRNSRKTIFINSITASRIKYVQDLRNNIAEFCGLFFRYNLLLKDDPKLSTEKLKILESSDKLKYLIMLYLNPEDKDWDKTIIQLIDDIRASMDQNPTDKINELIKITQYLLKLEWEGAKRESQKGILSKKEKDKLYKKYFKLYQKAILKGGTIK